MLNHIVTNIKAPKEVIDYLTQNGEVDFNLLNPNPHPSANAHNTHNSAYTQWNIDNWGTEWNAYHSYRPTNETVSFETLNSHPIDVIKILARKFPHALIDVRWASSELGYNFGHYRIKGGVLSPQRIPKEGTEAARIWTSDVK